MPIFSKPDDYKKHVKYVPLIKKALKLVNADPGKHFYYFKKYPFDPKPMPLLLVDANSDCRDAAIKIAGRVTAKGMVTLTEKDELKFTPKEGKINSIRLQKYFTSMGGGIKDVFIPTGEVDEDEDGGAGEGVVISQAKPTATVMPDLPSIPSTSASGGNKAMDRKMAFEEAAFKLKEKIAELQKMQFPADQQAKKDKALTMAEAFVAAGKHVDAAKLLGALAAQAKPGEATGSQQPSGQELKEEAKQVFAQSASTDAAATVMPDLPSIPSTSASGGNTAMDRKMAFEEAAFKLKEKIAELQKMQFPADQQAKKDKALTMAKAFVAAGKHVDAAKLLGALAAQAKLGEATGSQQPSGQELKEEAEQVFAQSASTDAAAPVMPDLPPSPQTDSPKAKTAMDRKMAFEEAAFKLNQQINAMKQMNFPPEQKANQASTLAKAQKLVAAGKHSEAERLLNELAEIKARLVRITTSQNTLNTLGQQLKPDEGNSFPDGLTKAIDKATDRTVGGHGPLFKPVLKALASVEKSTDEKDLAALEMAARNYLADFDRRVAEGKSKGKPFSPDKITTKKVEACKDAIERVRKLRVTRNIQDELANLPKNPQTADEEKAVNRLKAKMLVESGGSKQLGADQSGASESFFLTDPTSGEKAFIFKPADGEFDAGYGWKKGGGAPREVVLSAVNEAFKNSIGLDCGVSQTTLVAVDNPSVATERNGNNSRRTGAVQSFVKSDRELSEKLVEEKDFINQVPAEDIEKVALLDFATLQMDRQASNLLVQKDENGQPRLIPIDAGNAMPSRKAFEASRRMFTNNAVLGGDEAKKPFSADALKKINDIDADAIVAAMKKANAEMAAIDPNAASAVDDENIEMTRRSIQFLKKAAPLLTKEDIAGAYAYQFQNVLDAKPNDVDKAIDKAIKEALEKPAIFDEIDRIPNVEKRFAELGWPADQFVSLKAEKPARLLDILKKGTECPAILKVIQEAIDEVGINNFKSDPYAIKDVGKRRISVMNELEDARAVKMMADPQLDKKLKKAGAEFVTMDKKTQKPRPMSDMEKLAHAKKVNRYLESGGDDDLKRRGKSPGKITFEQKYFEWLGGDELIEELKQKGLNPYDGPNLAYKCGDLEDYKTYIALGGDEEYVRLGGPQNKEITLDNRVKLIKARRALE